MLIERKRAEKEWLKFLAYAFVCANVVALISVLQYASLEAAANVSVSVFLKRRVVYHLFGCGCALAVTSLFVLLTGRFAVSCIISSVFFALFSIVNHQLMLFYGEPFSLSMIWQIPTALDVTGGYSFYMDRRVAAIIAILVYNIGLCLVLECFLERRVLQRRRPFLRVMGLCCTLLMLLGARLIVHKELNFGLETNNFGWLFNSRNLVKRCGSLGWTLSSSYFAFSSPLREPPGYSADEVRKLANVRGGVCAGVLNLFPTLS